jgi:hypothetical protein
VPDARCPYCGEAAATLRDEVEHMNSAHPGIVAERLLEAGELGPAFDPRWLNEDGWLRAARCSGCGDAVLIARTMGRGDITLTARPDPDNGRFVLARDGVAIALTGLLPRAREAAREQRMTLYAEHRHARMA